MMHFKDHGDKHTYTCMNTYTTHTTHTYIEMYRQRCAAVNTYVHTHTHTCNFSSLLYRWIPSRRISCTARSRRMGWTLVCLRGSWATARWAISPSEEAEFSTRIWSASTSPSKMGHTKVGLGVLGVCFVCEFISRVFARVRGGGLF